MRLFVAALSCSVLLSTSLHSQSVVAGTVRQDSTGRPLQGVEVLIEGLDKHVLTDQNGRYLLGKVPRGAHVALFRSVGYRPQRLALRISDVDTLWANVLLVASTVVLDPIVVKAEAKQPRGAGFEAFEERRRMGFGSFIDSTELQRVEQLHVPDVLRRYTRVRLIQPNGAPPGGRPGEAVYAVGTRRPGANGRPCYMQVIVNGIVWRPPANLNDFGVSELAAIEVYYGAGGTPSEFNNSDAGCGTVVLWTKPR